MRISLIVLCFIFLAVSCREGARDISFDKPVRTNDFKKSPKSSKILQEKTFGGDKDDEANSIISAPDGYLLVGHTESKGAGGQDVWVIKLDTEGNKIWDKTFGGSKFDMITSVISISDGYLLAGFTLSKGAKLVDAWVIKLDKNGDQKWEKIFGGDDLDTISSAISIPDGFLLVGATRSKGAGDKDAWVIKLDKDGNKSWEKTFGGSKYDRIFSIISTQDGFLLGGTTGSKGAGKFDVWVVKLDKSGNQKWDKTFGGSKYDEINSIISTPDGYLLAGYTNSKGAGDKDAWIIKLDKNGGKLWDKTFGGSKYDTANSIISIQDGYLLAGTTESKGAGEKDVWIIKLDKNGN